MTDDPFSEALIAYVWGDPRLPWPSERPEALNDEQIDYLPRIRAAVAVAFAETPDHEDLDAAATRREVLVRTTFPELNDEAIRAVGNLFYYNWK